MPHWSPSDRTIQSGDVILIDMGSCYNGYCSDMTRTIFVEQIDENIKQIYDLVQKNQKIAIEQINDGTQVKTIAKIVESNLRMNGFEPMHALGHGVRTRHT